MRETLRWATRDSHARLDALFEGVADPAQTAIYEAFLRMNRAALEGLEPLLAASPLARHGLVPETRLPALRRDLAALGLAPIAVPAFPFCALTLHQGAGIAYVVEGSRLGATFIARRLGEAAAAGAGDPPRDFLLASAHAAAFRTFMDGLATLPWDAATLDEAAGAANAAFAHFHLCARLAGA